MARGHLNKSTKSVAHPAVIVVGVSLAMGLAAIALGWLQFGISIEPINSEVPIAPQSADSLPQDLAARSPSPSSLPTAKTPLASAPTVNPDGLRVSNQTNQPIRIALLAQQSVSDTADSEAKSSYAEPAHWDFAPLEGSSRGLLLSLPQGSLKLKPGDILVAFAQDGSRRYWGPFVVGETQLPVQNDQSKEWQLILRP